MPEKIDLGQAAKALFTKLTAVYAVYSDDSFALLSGRDILGAGTEGGDFFATASRAAAMLNRDSLTAAIETDGATTVTICLGGDRYYGLVAAFCDETIVLSFQDITAMKRRASAPSEKSFRDALTGVKSVHAFTDTQVQMDRRIAEGDPMAFSVCVCSVRGLASVVNSQGQRAGDEYLKAACMEVCRTFAHSPVFRIGADEFAVISQGSDYDIADGLLAALKEHERTLSCGLSKFLPGSDRSVSDVFGRAYSDLRGLRSAQN